MLGITDGIYTEMVSGDLSNGEKLIIGDSSPETAGTNQMAGAMGGPFGFGRRR